jgi:hypothetical protein
VGVECHYGFLQICIPVSIRREYRNIEQMVDGCARQHGMPSVFSRAVSSVNVQGNTGLFPGKTAAR